MEIYIEYVIIDNLVINSLILLCVIKTLKLKSSWWRILFSSLLGTTVAVLLPMFKLHSLLLIFIKIALGIVMTLIISKFYRIKDYIFAFLLFIAYTFLLVGACLTTLLVCGTSLDLLKNGGYDIAIPLGIILLIICVYVYFIIMLGKYLSRKKELIPYLRKIKIYIKNKELDFYAFIDSGNKLYDFKSGLPIIILSIKGMECFYSKEEIENLVLNNGKNTDFKNVHYTNYNTISGEAKKMVVFEADKMVIKNEKDEYITNRFMIGLTYKTFNDAVKYDVLLHPAVM